MGDVLSKGRAGHWLFLKAAVALQAEPNAARILFVSASIVAYAVFGLAVVRFWGGRLPRTEWGDMNISAFAPTWSQVHLLREASGYDLKSSTDPQEKAAADAYCAGAEPWPAQDSVVLRDSLAIICVGSPKNR